MSIGQCFFDNEGVGGVVIEWVTESRGFGSALSGMIVTRGLYDLPKLTIRSTKARVRFLDMHSAKLDPQIRFCQAETYNESMIAIITLWI